MTSLMRSFKYEISSVSPNCQLEEEEIWAISLWRNLVLLAGVTFSTSKIKHFFMQFRGGPCQAPATSAEQWPHRGSPGMMGAGEEQLQKGWKAEVENNSPGDTESCWFCLSSMNNPPLAAGNLWYLIPHSWIYGAVHAGDVFRPLIPAQCHAKRCTLPTRTKLLRWLLCVGKWASGTVSCNWFSGLGTAEITQR